MEMEDDSSLNASDSDYNFLHTRPRKLLLNFEETENEASSVDYKVDRPCTPNNRSSDVSSDFSLTPLPSMECDDVSSFKMYGVDRNMNKSRLTSTPMISSAHSCSFPIAHNRRFSPDIRQCRSAENPRLYRFGTEELPLEYMNPFTPNGKLLLNRVHAQKQLKRLSINPSENASSNGLSLDLDDMQVPERRRLCDFNVSRFNEEFVQIKAIGKGYHGCVYKCVNRMNGCLYAIKRTLNPIKSGTQEKIIRNEIYAHGILDHPNIVRNFSCWKEEGYVYIQNEYCNGGNLEDYMELNYLSEPLLRSLLFQMANALRYLHHKGLVHMDIKPENILLSIDNAKENSFDSTGSYDASLCDSADSDIVFKLGDLGHITRLDENDDVEEGDCRFLPMEILKCDYSHLDRADIFALGLTLYSAAGAGPLPKNGDAWHEIRHGKIKYFDNHSKEFNNILKSMINIIPEKRPSAAELIEMVKMNPLSPTRDVYDQMQKYQLNKCSLEQKIEKRGQLLRAMVQSHRQLQEQLNEFPSNKPFSKEKCGIAIKRGPPTKPRTVGKRTKRSSSTTLF